MEEIREVGVADMLRARDERCLRQQSLLKEYGLPVLSFTMNIAGPVKTDGLIRCAFFEGVSCIARTLKARRIAVVQEIQTLEFTGNEQLWAVDADAAMLKKWMLEIEETHPLGRLFDIDVLNETGEKLARSTHRKCLICGGDVHICGRSRTHSAQELYRKVREIIRDYFNRKYARHIGMCAQRALLYEAVTTPKPGLVDAQNSGAHRDMDLFTFMDGASALRSWFEEAAYTGMQQACDEDAFAALRARGIAAEAELFSATGGVNTHKGALFSLGIACCAAGRVGKGSTAEVILAEAAKIASHSLSDFEALSHENARTGGEKQYLTRQLTGIRGEAAAGFPAVAGHALPAFRAALLRGESLNNAGLHALVALMACLPDSNILRRKGPAALADVQACAEALARNGFVHADLQRMNEAFVQENISPGGSADLLALTYFLYFITQDANGATCECMP